MKIAFLGAGSFVFGETVLMDILNFPELIKDTVIYLEDIDEQYLDLMYQYMVKAKESNHKLLEGVSFEKTTNQKKALEDAKYVINAIHVGGYDAYKVDMDIPYKYGVTQCVGDTLGPGGIFRFLRNVSVMKTVMEDIRDVGYKSENADAPLLLNYTNPMAMLTWYCNSLLPDSTIGLCHGVFHTAAGLSVALGVKPQNFDYFCAGINHMAWFLELWYKESNNPEETWKDAYPKLFQILKSDSKLEEMERLRVDMMKAVGYFMTESSGHLSEYLPYYRKRKDLLEKYRGINMLFSNLEHNYNYEFSKANSESLDKTISRKLKRKKSRIKKPSEEYASHIMNAIETDVPYRFNGNVINKKGGIITNLPEGCCVEVPVFADAHGLHPQGGIELPTVCQALCISNIMVQKSAVEGALELDREKIYHAVLLDPNTASVCSPSEIREMVNEMFEAEEKWIPKFP